MDSNPLHHTQPAHLQVLRVFMKMLDDVSTPTMRPPAHVQKTMWSNFLQDIGVGYDREHQLEVQNAQRFMVACIRYDIPT